MVRITENTDPEIRPQLEENLLHGQYASFQELIDDVREMTYALGSVRRSYFCPLRGSVDDGEYEDLCDADNRFLRDYAWAIQEKLEEDQAAPEAAMAQFFHDDAGVKAKLVSAVWNVEGYRGQLYGKIECRFKEQLTEAEEEIFRKWISGQCSDGYGILPKLPAGRAGRRHEPALAHGLQPLRPAFGMRAGQRRAVPVPAS